LGIFRRLPPRQQVAQVYAITVLLLYSWTTLWFLWKLPSWLGFLNTGEILTIAAYSLATNFIESLAVLSAPVILALALPDAWFRRVFVARGSALMMTGIGAMMVLTYQYTNKDELPQLLRSAWPPALMLFVVAAGVYFAGRVRLLRWGLEGLADRATIFLYASVPLSILSLLVIAVRWLG